MELRPNHATLVLLHITSARPNLHRDAKSRTAENGRGGDADSQVPTDAGLAHGYAIAIEPVVPVTRHPVPGWFCTT